MSLYSNEKTFKPSTKTNQVDYIVDQLIEAIKNKDLKINDQIPPERKLAEEFSVSRGTIREALSILQTMGILEVKHGVGTFVKNSPDSIKGGSVWSPWLKVNYEDIIDLLEVREALELKAIELAYKKGWDDLVPKLEKNIDKMEKSIREGNKKILATIDIEFHSLINGAAKNKFIVELTKKVNNKMKGERRAVLGMPRRAQISLIEHKEICKMIKQNNLEAAKKAVMIHINSVEKHIQEDKNKQ